ncbi:hypothetical protein CLF_102061 [Clonorchis sinensis]|uniref:C2H2-type domain-containing protein n=1 Tax=Clonorchis sinensis TaxID=79923 RepID=G7Y773_CLOSI|nr:hypothetical protein CLF_102061 [Clonorchis sinensis]
MLISVFEECSKSIVKYSIVKTVYQRSIETTPLSVIVPLLSPSFQSVTDQVHSFSHQTPISIRNCVYRIKCNDCTKVYIGQTARELHTRIGEHKRSINRPPRNIDEYQAIVNDSAMAGHALDTGHRIDLENVDILRRGLKFTPQRLVTEAMEIAKHPSVNRIEGVELASVWRAVLDQPR